MQRHNPIVIALGGSIVHPKTIDSAYLKALRHFLSTFTRSGYRFIIVIGGGSLARTFQASVAQITRITNEDKDWLGIHATRLHAHLLRTVFRDVADPIVIDERDRLKKLSHPLTIASGWRPGWSTDYVAAVLAHDFRAKEFIVAGKPAYVYSKDPQKYQNAVPVSEISWRAYRKLIPANWSPGSHAPVDPIASQFAQTHHLTAIILNGKDLKNLSNLLRGKKWRGTTIQ